MDTGYYVDLTSVKHRAFLHSLIQYHQVMDRGEAMLIATLFVQFTTCWLNEVVHCKNQPTISLRMFNETRFTIPCKLRVCRILFNFEVKFFTFCSNKFFSTKRIFYQRVCVFKFQLKKAIPGLRKH